MAAALILPPGPMFLRGRKVTTVRTKRCSSAESAGQAQCFQHFDPKCPLMYGKRMPEQMAPLVFLVGPKSEELAEYIRDDPAGPFVGEHAWPDVFNSTEDVGYKSEQEAPLAPGRWRDFDFQFSEREHFLLKADCHSVYDWGKQFDLFVPRKYSIQSCRLAPPRLSAFVEAFRSCNEACWQEMAHGLELLKAKAPNDFDRCRLLDLLLETFHESGHFAAVEIQAGPSFASKNMRWHKDGATGLLHMGITFSGTRKFKFRSANGEHEEAERELFLDAGSIYVSSPFLYDHSVSYYKAREETGPLFTAMCRFGFLQEKDAMWANHLYGPDMLEVAELIATCLKEAVDKQSLRLPSLREVQDVEIRHKS